MRPATRQNRGRHWTMVGGYRTPLAFHPSWKTNPESRVQPLRGIKMLASPYWTLLRQRPIISTVGLPSRPVFDAVTRYILK